VSAGRIAQTTEVTSDEARVRPILFGAAVAGVAALVLVAVAPRARAPGPVSLPHERAKIACSGCHGHQVGESAGASASCARCHGAHPSTRTGHRALAARGELGCTACHSAHGGEGVTFAGEKQFVLWGPDGEVPGTASLDAPAGVTVPFVGVGSCGRCHRLDDPRDPLAPCLREGRLTCFDEHERGGGTSDRFVAWEAAREIAARRPGPSVRSALAPSSFAWAGAALGIGFVGFAALAGRPCPRRRPAPAVVSARVRLPVIDAATCLGCSACVDACPFDVLAIDRFVAVVARPSECCGAIVCADVCPNGSLRIESGDLAPGRPRVNANLESLDQAGVFLAGDLTGLPLVRNAIRQGASVAERVARTLDRTHPELDLIVVGAGPAGLSAMLRAKELGLRAVCLEQWAFAASIRNFPRDKIVFDLPGGDPLEGPLWMKEATKEELIAQWGRAVRASGIDVREYRRVTDVSRDEDGFVVTSLRGDAGADVERGARAYEVIRAARVILAIGKRGTPRKLPMSIAPGAEGLVSYALADAKSLSGKRVLVIGLGDTAIEAAIALAHQPRTSVTISYRGTSIARGKQRNVAALSALVAGGRVRLAFESTVAGVEPGFASLVVRGESEKIPVDAVLVLVGGVPSWELMARAGVRPTGESGREENTKTDLPVCP
jgi:thioredoxin reductase/Pyruvate/2-oxoacid:ferredoxin oxidoreductase delta subunit